MPDILHTLLQTGKCPSPGGSGAPCNTWFLGPTESPYHKQQLNWFSHFCSVQGCDQQTHKPCHICSNRSHLAFVLPCSRKTTQYDHFSIQPSTCIIRSIFATSVDCSAVISALEWIRSFLTDRTQQVSYCGRLSPIQCVLFGVPQGSVLGPLLYVLYAAELELPGVPQHVRRRCSSGS